LFRHSWPTTIGGCPPSARNEAERSTTRCPSGTRWYLHLDRAGRAYVYREGGRYQEVDPKWLLEVVLAGRWGRGNIVQQNVLAEFKLIRWARSATKHRISRKRARHVIEQCVLRYMEDPPADAPIDAVPRLVYLGDDENGIALEVIAVEREDRSLFVIHAMQLRDRYRLDYEEAKRWQV
jgi:hypothetical protein